MQTKKVLFEKFRKFQNELNLPVIIKYIPNISRDFLNEAKTKDIKSFILEMNPMIIRSTLASANDHQLEKVITAIQYDRKLIGKLNRSLT